MRKADFMVDGIVTVVKTVEWMFSDCCSSAVRSRLYTRVGAPWEIQIVFSDENIGIFQRISRTTTR